MLFLVLNSIKKGFQVGKANAQPELLTAAGDVFTNWLIAPYWVLHFLPFIFVYVRFLGFLSKVFASLF